ncbi:MAG: hypothetical protein JO052_05710, partial [Bradyrhizobium sp.]|nr:hypothetical protein [Bradyrhizobium sp.]
MIGRAHRFIISGALTAAVSALLLPALTRPAAAVCEVECSTSPSPSPSPSPSSAPSATPTPTPTPSPTVTPTPTPSPTGADSSAGSINGLADQRFNQMITNKVLGSVLLGVNEQINCTDCISAFGSAGSFSAGVHGRKELTQNLSFLAGIAYTQYSENGYHVTSAPIGAFALRYDFTDWGSSRPFFDVGAILTPWEKVRYSRSYLTNFGPVLLTSSTDASNYAAFGRGGWISRVSPRDEVAGYIEFWQLWQHVGGTSDPAAAFNPFTATVSSGTDRTSLVKIGGQWTHMLTPTIEGNINGGWTQSFATHSGIVATVTGNGLVVPTMGNQGWFEYGSRLGFRLSRGWVADLF